MGNILALREKRAAVWEKAKSFLDTHHDKDGMLSPEDEATYDSMEKEVIQLGNQIDRLELQRSIDDSMKSPTSDPITNPPGKNHSATNKTGRASDDYKKAFWGVFRNKNFVDIKNSLSEGTDANGGYLVPDEYERTLIQALEDETFFRSIATVIYTASGDRSIPVVTGHGTAAWIDENGSYPESDDEFSTETLSSYKAGTAIRVSDELLNDSAFDLSSYIAGEFGRRIGVIEEQAFLVGDGLKKPKGIFTTAGTGVTAASDKVTFDTMMDLYHSLRTPYRRKASFILNDSTIKAIRKLKDNNGFYIWQPSVQVGVPDSILNRPYHTSDYAPELTAGKKAIAFGDFSYYWIADRQNRSFKRLNELYATSGQVGFLASERVDGKLILSEAVKLLEISAG